MEHPETQRSLIAADWEDRAGVVVLENDEAPCSFDVRWEIEALPSDNEHPRLYLRRLDLVASSIEVPGGLSGLLSVTSLPQSMEASELIYDAATGSFTARVPALIHAQMQADGVALPEDGGCTADPQRSLVHLLFEGRWHGRPSVGREGPVGLDVEIRGLTTSEDETDLSPRLPAAHSRPLESLRILRPVELAPGWLQRIPVLRGLHVRTEGEGTQYPPLFCQHHASVRLLRLQPVFVDARGPDPLDPDGINRVRDLADNPHKPGVTPPWQDVSKISGKSFEPLYEAARLVWGKVCVELEVLPPQAVRDADFFVLNSLLEAGQFSQSVKPNKRAVPVFVADSWDVRGPARPAKDPAPANLYGQGAYVGLGGTAQAYVMTVDSQLNIPATGSGACGNGATGAVNRNLLAHEIGHVLGLAHPGTWHAPMPPLPTSYGGSKGSVMEPSGYCADGPSLNSRRNAALIHNPLLRTIGSCCAVYDIDDPIGMP
ncbi:MAG: hypothetical protein WBG92_21035 [Thiohalocapsa sp.]